MGIAPRQNWTALRKLAKDADAAWVRGLSIAERFDLYADMFRIVWEAQRSQEVGKRLENWNWDRKVAARRHQIHAFSKLDELTRARAASFDSR
jgi:hypothetical protein